MSGSLPDQIPASWRCVSYLVRLIVPVCHRTMIVSSLENTTKVDHRKNYFSKTQVYINRQNHHNECYPVLLPGRQAWPALLGSSLVGRTYNN